MEILIKLFEFFDITREPNAADAASVLSIIFLVLVSFKNFLTRKKKGQPQVAELAKVQQSAVQEISFKERLQKGLKKSQDKLKEKLGLISWSAEKEEQLESLEEALYTADLGGNLSKFLLEQAKVQLQAGKLNNLEDLKLLLKNSLRQELEPMTNDVISSLYHMGPQSKTQVIMIVGVNGAGKTTTIGKLASRLKRSGANVVVGACDTFRAAAVDQLQTWCERADVTLIQGKDNADPSGVAYETLAKAQSMKADYCLLDTAGRLHTKTHLMEELKKNKRVLQKLNAEAPHETLLVIDAITGQNAMRQAEEFHQALDLTGLIFTKCDGSSKAGQGVEMMRQLQRPILFIGVGEQVEDLDRFVLDDYLDSLF